MNHQRFPSHEVKEPHSVSLKVLRLSRPSLVPQFPLHPPVIPPSLTSPIAGTSPAALPQRHLPPLPASLAYSPLGPIKKHGEDAHEAEGAGGERTRDGYYNTEPFILSPIVNLPPSFGSAYVGETFSCTLCANHNAPPIGEGGTSVKKTIRDVKIEAEMQTPSGQTTKLVLGDTAGDDNAGSGSSTANAGNDNAITGSNAIGSEDSNNTTEAKTETETVATLDLLPPSTTLQKILNFGLKEEGTHVLGVTVSYYEATETSGRTRAFRKMYQFICKPSLIVRTKAGPLPSLPPVKAGNGKRRRRWVLEAQLENCSEDAILLEKAQLAEVQRGLKWRDCNWAGIGVGVGQRESTTTGEGISQQSQDQSQGPSRRPFLQPGESEQLCFIIEEMGGGEGDGDGGEQEEEREAVEVEEKNGRIDFGVMALAWRTEMGNRGSLLTLKLGTKHVKPR
ncbi:hypothetical protein QR685DRAFT_562831 [Neurospora intermedia]|uniref:Trafficking protein particle complex subunit 13 N-terminal domain-containing protein n=1 Tax=Neurospora intermedia TaxID=5142 RepID=A0ABR3DDT1_NEUIN